MRKVFERKKVEIPPLTGEDLDAVIRFCAPAFSVEDDPSPYDWEDALTEPAAVREAIRANRLR